MGEKGDGFVDFASAEGGSNERDASKELFEGERSAGFGREMAERDCKGLKILTMLMAFFP